jgi:hypothetical protein
MSVEVLVAALGVLSKGFPALKTSGGRVGIPTIQKVNDVDMDTSQGLCGLVSHCGPEVLM